jgi:CelD/BcsL family acetyltransferase involved in cellulose biosynthesis
MSVLATTADHEVIVEAHDWATWQSLATAWSSLASECDRPTFFLTPESVETWLQVFGEQLRPTLLFFKTRAGELVGACIVVRRTERKGPFLVRRVYLNTAGEHEADSPCIEYNELLCKPGHASAMASALRSYLDASWDELRVDGMQDGPSLRALERAFGDAHPIDTTTPSYYIDLEELRGSGGDFVEKLASRERTKVRHNLRKYSSIGELVVEEAGTTRDALSYLDQLATLHQRTWLSRGKPGAFASPTFCDYHRHLIERCFPLGHIQLLHVRAGDATVGYHYNLVFGGRSFFYQCGYDYELDKKLSPGVTVHALAIRHALEHGLAAYEFMAGDVEYKRRLATHSRPMHWIAWQAPTVKMKGYELARLARRAVRQRASEVTSNLRGSLLGLVTPHRGQA